jgi:hypothetical protein
MRRVKRMRRRMRRRRDGSKCDVFDGQAGLRQSNGRETRNLTKKKKIVLGRHQ